MCRVSAADDRRHDETFVYDDDPTRPSLHNSVVIMVANSMGKIVHSADGMTCSCLGLGMTTNKCYPSTGGGTIWTYWNTLRLSRRSFGAQRQCASVARVVCHPRDMKTWSTSRTWQRFDNGRRQCVRHEDNLLWSHRASASNPRLQFPICRQLMKLTLR